MRSWLAIERLQQGESLNIQDVKDQSVMVFRKFTSRDGETMESYYSRIYKLMNELTRNNLQVTTMQVNVQFLQQLQPEGKYQNEVMYFRAERIAKSEKSIRLLAAAQPYSDNLLSTQNLNEYNALTAIDLATMPKECRKLKEVFKGDYSYHKDMMIDVQQAEQAHYSFMAKIQEVLPEESSSTEQPLEHVQNNDENNVFANKRQHSENNTAECVVEPAALANLIANLTLDTEKNKTILKQLNKANASLNQELEECNTNLDETSRALGDATSCRDSCLIALRNKRISFKKYHSLMTERL
ncbi:hypothetical protein Tco_0665493 [Tanacetum coccineum]